MRSSNDRASRSGDRRCSSKALAIPVKPSAISRSLVVWVSIEILPGSVEIALTADVAVAQRLVIGRLVEESAIKAVFENRADRSDGACLDEDGALAGCIDARFVVAPGQRENAEAGAKALIGMRPVSDESLEEGGGGGADLFAGKIPPQRPLAVATVRARLIVNRRVAAQVGRTGVAGGHLTLVEDLDHRVGDAHIDEFADEAVGRGIPVPVDLDMIVRRDAATLPARKDVWPRSSLSLD